MGGEPTTHPQFLELLAIAQNNFEEVSIFTNAISPTISNVSLRDKDKVVYNFKFSQALDANKLLLGEPGKRALEVQVLRGLNIEKVKNEIQRIAKILPEVEVYLTLDCTTDIFMERNSVIPIYEDLQNYCKDHNIKQGQDHILPLCYVKGSRIPLPRSGAFCNIQCSGLIDSHYNIRFCNQHQQVLGNMYDSKMQLIDWNSFVSLLNSKYFEIREQISNKECRDCIFLDVYCNGGCFKK